MMNAFTRVAAGLVLGTAVFTTGAYAHDAPQGASFTPEEKAVIGLVHEYNACIKEKEVSYRGSEQEIKNEASAIYEKRRKEVEALDGADLNAAVARVLMEKHRPMTESQAERVSSGLNRAAKLNLLAQYETKRRAEMMSDADLDDIVLKVATRGGQDADDVRRNLAAATRTQKVAYLVQSASHASGLENMPDAELNAAAVKALMGLNSGASREEVEKVVAKSSQEEKVALLAEYLAGPEMEEVVLSFRPDVVCQEEINVNGNDLQDRLSSIVDKHGPAPVKEELHRLDQEGLPQLKLP